MIWAILLPKVGNMTKIKSLEHLQKLADNNCIICTVISNYGMERNEQITYWPQDDSYIVYHEINEEEEEFKNTEEFKKSSVFEALGNGVLYKYE